MKKELILNYNLSIDFISEFVPLVIRAMGSQKYIAKSLQISWKNVCSVYTGIIDIQLSNDESKYATAEQFTIDKADNSGDVVICDINTSAEYLRFKYTKNEIESGKLEILIIYERS